MKFPLFIITVLIFTSAASAQDAPRDSAPVIQGSSTYTMPPSAIDAEIDGAVAVGIHVDETGKPTKVVIISGPNWPCGATPTKALEGLSSTLTEALMKLRFSPAIKDGKPDEANIVLTINLKNPKLGPVPSEIDPSTGKPKAKTVSGGVLNGKAKYLAIPAYPSEARANGDAGSVTVQVLINEEGKVLRAFAVSGAPTLRLAARDAACKSKFSPTLLQGNPVKVSGVITYFFVR